jgi:hypothetical protein
MYRPPLVLLFVVLSATCYGDLLAQSAKINFVADKETTNIPVVFHPETFAVWSGGALVILEDRFSSNPLIHIVDREGNEVSRFLLTIPHGGGFIVGDWKVARGWDGVVAVAGSMDFPEQHGSFLAIVSPDGSNQKFVRLAPYVPDSVTVAGDGTIWVVGSYVERNVPVDRDQDLIRRYDKSGTLLDSFVTWGSMETANDPARGSILMATKDRVGWYSKHAHTYMEFSLDQTVITRVKSWASSVEDPLDWPALCQDGSVFVAEQAQSTHETQWGIFSLDRQTGKWNFIPSKERIASYGCEGSRLATTSDFGRSISWLEPRAF